LQANIDSKDTILARRRFHDDTERKEKIHDLRLIACNYLDITSGNTMQKPLGQDGKFADVDVRDWEMGRHNSIMVATQIQAKGLTFNAPDLTYTGIPAENPETVALVRRHWFLEEYERQQMQHSIMWMALDAIISGEGGMCGGVRDNDTFLEWSDSLRTTWDPVYRETHKKRFVFKDVPMPLGDAIQAYPKLEKEFHKPTAAKLEETVFLTFYYSKTTRAVLYKKVFIQEPEQTPYGRIPASRMMLFHQPGLKFSSGSVESQVGTEQLKLRLQRYFRETALRGGSPVGVAKGSIAEGEIDDIIEGEECAVIRFDSPSGDFEWKPGAEISDTSIKLYQMLDQMGNAESGVNAFQQSRTDVKVDFATQLQYMAAQSGVQSKFIAQQLELAIKDSIDMYMDLGQRWAQSRPLRIGDATIPFGPDMPVNPMLGSDGKLVLKANATEYKSSAQKLQEAALFGNVIGMATSMPQGLQVPFVKLAADSFEVENPETWVEGMLQAQEQQMMMQAQAAAQPPNQNQPQPTQAA
jgi:hypothetical protein